MCGFCGYVARPELVPPPEAGRAMNATLVHRGPDGDGELAIASAGEPELAGWLGHRRLRIVDLTEHAHQPMRSADGSVALVYNGEVYNFRELRRELSAAGARFESSGDTEVVLRAYEAWGADFVARLDGMFALAVWDARIGRLLLARDRTGKKPLFYTERDGLFVFGSELKAVLAAPSVSAEIDGDRLPELFTYGYVPWPHTFYRGILQVPPAATVSFDADGVSAPVGYWDALPGEQDLTAAEAARAIPGLLERATARRLIADVPLGAFLSGGLDSSVVVGLMSRTATEPVRTFSIGFPEEPSIDESRYARLVADHFATRHVEFSVRADALALMDTLLWHHDGPYADSSAIPTYLVSQLAREHVTVALNGDGGDEVFGGYGRFAAAKLVGLVPDPVARAAAPLRHGLPRRMRRRADRFVELSRSPPEDRYQSWIAGFNSELLPELLPNRNRDGVMEAMERSYRRAAHLPALDRILYANFKSYLPDDLAVKMDRMSMANSLETRSPFLDTALIEYVARVSAAQKVGLRRVKPLLRRSFWPLLPREIWNRPKQGFGVPMDRWFRGDLRTVFEDEVLAGDARSSAYLDAGLVRRMWSEHQDGTVEHGPNLWTVLTFERWLRIGPPGLSAGVPSPAPVIDADQRASRDA